MTTSQQILAVTISAILILGVTLPAAGGKTTYCGSDFGEAVYEICTQLKRSSPFWERLNSGSRIRRFAERQLWEDIYNNKDISTMSKRQMSAVGIAAHCCTNGCQESDIAQVC